MNMKMIWSHWGHIVFAIVCLICGIMIGMSATISCGYSGKDCQSVGVWYFLAATVALLVIGYLVRFLAWYFAIGLTKVRSKIIESAARKEPRN
jgi:membrane protein YdbS with pleckstrin-like domain